MNVLSEHFDREFNEDWSRGVATRTVRGLVNDATIIETMARGMFRLNRDPSVRWEKAVPMLQEHYRTMARAALRALTEEQG